MFHILPCMMYLKSLVKILLPIMDLNMVYKTKTALKNTLNSDFRKTREIWFSRDTPVLARHTPPSSLYLLSILYNYRPHNNLPPLPSLLQTMFAVLALFAVTLPIFIAPYSKVEESFHTQATHDLIYKNVLLSDIPPLFFSDVPLSCPEAGGTSTACSLLSFDHLEFPGVVPRSFLPSVLISSVLKPFQYLPSPPSSQTFSLLSRLLLALLQYHATLRLASALPTRATRNAFLLITAVQPHLNFYASRFLPNSFALLLTTHAFACWLGKAPYKTIALLTFAAATVRCDILVLAAPVGLSLLVTRKVKLLMGILTGVATLLLTLLVIVPLDTVMWNNFAEPKMPPLRYLWAEGVVLFYNTVENKVRI